MADETNIVGSVATLAATGVMLYGAKKLIDATSSMTKKKHEHHKVVKNILG